MHNASLAMSASRIRFAWRLSASLRPKRLVLRHPSPSKSPISTRVSLSAHLPSVRHASSKYNSRAANVKAKEVPQGLLEPAHPLPPLQNTLPTYPIVIQQARDNMARFSSCVVLTRVGGFYELYCEHALTYGPLLGIKVASKNTKDMGRVAMAGFPFMQLDRYLKVLVQDHGFYVAISEERRLAEDERVKVGGNLFERKVTRVVTRGTLLDERWLVGGENNWCAAVWLQEGAKKEEKGRCEEEDSEAEHNDTGGQGSGREDGQNGMNQLAAEKLRLSRSSVGAAWLDLSTGEFFTQETTLADLPSLLSRISPKEILLPDNIVGPLKGLLMDTLGPEQLLVSWHPAGSGQKNMNDWASMLDSTLSEDTKKALTADEISAGSLLLNYVKERLFSSNTKIRPPVKRRDTDNMIIDKDTLRGLEILETIRDSRAKGSLLHAVNRTVTNSGARLLRDRIVRPSTVPSVVNDRLDLVEHLLAEQELQTELLSFLKSTFDSQRLIQKFALGRADADDLVSLSRTIQLTENMASALCKLDNVTPLSRLGQKFSLEEASALSARIADAIDEDGLIAAHEQQQDETSSVINTAQEILGQGEIDDIQALGTVIRAKPKVTTQLGKDEDTWIMRKSASSALTELHDTLDALIEQKDELCDELKAKTQIRSLTLQWQPSLGYICHVKGKGAKSVQSFIDAIPEATVVRGLKTTSAFYVSEWRQLGKQIDEAKTQIRSEEQVVFRDLRDEVVRNLLKLRRNAAILDELDVACSSATLAREQDAVRPILDNSRDLEIVAGRHPTVTLGLEERGRPFVSNDCFLFGQSPQERVESPAGDTKPSAPSPSTSGSSNVDGASTERIWLITGPNMGGKSTFLRQNALLALLAQCGLFVPAEYARIGIVDALFARIGSADNLFSDQSTFMTEMLETAHILNNATKRSLVIMDEIGRGTTPTDGEALASATLEHLLCVNKCRGLFATHFHQLTNDALASGWKYGSQHQNEAESQNPPSRPHLSKPEDKVNYEATFGPGAAAVGFYCTDIKELAGQDDGFVFMHKLKRGVNTNSYAFKVAAMAGIPKSVVDSAEHHARHSQQGEKQRG